MRTCVCVWREGVRMRLSVCACEGRVRVWLCMRRVCELNYHREHILLVDLSPPHPLEVMVPPPVLRECIERV